MWFTTESTVPVGFHLGNRVCPAQLLRERALDCFYCYGLRVWVRFLWRAAFWFNSWSAVLWISSRELFKVGDNTNGLLGLMQDTFLSILRQFSNGSKWVGFRKLLAHMYVHSHTASRRSRQFRIILFWSIHISSLFETFETKWGTGDCAIGSHLGLGSE